MVVLLQGVVPELPLWMKNIMDKIKNPRTTRNVKLYLTKLIINTSSVSKTHYGTISVL
jgi:hypothetical protein